MQVSVAFRHMEPSPSVQRYASEKLQHVVSKYVSGMDIDSQIVFSTERFLHVANFTITINGLTVKSVEKSEDMYSSIDLALEKVERQVRRFKTKIREHRPDNRRKAFTMQVITAADTDTVESDIEDETVTTEVQAVGEENTQLGDTKPVGEKGRDTRTIKREQYAAPYMSPEDAIVQLELRGSEFFVFTNAWNEHICIVYRRDDGNFGLIEPETAGVAATA